jgi:hypothetical protein
MKGTQLTMQAIMAGAETVDICFVFFCYDSYMCFDNGRCRHRGFLISWRIKIPLFFHCRWTLDLWRRVAFANRNQCQFSQFTYITMQSAESVFLIGARFLTLLRGPLGSRS